MGTGMDDLTIPSLEELAAQARSLLATTRGRVLIGITGAPGAGKSTLAEALVDVLADVAALVPMDGYHLADEELARLGLSDRKGSPPTFDRGGFATILERLRAAADPNDPPIYLPRFHREIEAAVAGSIPVAGWQRLLIVEGNYLLLWPEVQATLDLTWFVDPPSPARLRALIARHVDYGRDEEAAQEWVMRSDEANAALVNAEKHRADLLVSWAG
jgi:pantothenate kinase